MPAKYPLVVALFDPDVDDVPDAVLAREPRGVG
jgi:hypothetical protein